MCMCVCVCACIELSPFAAHINLPVALYCAATSNIYFDFETLPLLYGLPGIRQGQDSSLERRQIVWWRKSDSIVLSYWLCAEYFRPSCWLYCFWWSIEFGSMREGIVDRKLFSFSSMDSRVNSGISGRRGLEWFR